MASNSFWDSFRFGSSCAGRGGGFVRAEISTYMERTYCNVLNASSTPTKLSILTFTSRLILSGVLIVVLMIIGFRLVLFGSESKKGGEKSFLAFMNSSYPCHANMRATSVLGPGELRILSAAYCWLSVSCFPSSKSRLTSPWLRKPLLWQTLCNFGQHPCFEGSKTIRSRSPLTRTKACSANSSSITDSVQSDAAKAENAGVAWQSPDLHGSQRLPYLSPIHCRPARRSEARIVEPKYTVAVLLIRHCLFEDL